MGAAACARKPVPEPAAPPAAGRGRAGEPDEGALVRAAIAGDRLAFRVLYERTSGAAFRMAMRIVRQGDLAEEIVQEAFCQAWSAMRTFKGASAFGTWVLSIARHVALDMLRRAKTRKTLPGGDLLEGLRERRPEAVDARLRGNELGAALDLALGELPEESRAAFTLAAIERLPYAEIAEVLGTTVDGIKCRVFRAREHLRTRLARFDEK